jgi:LCP family protein required for cell wall assembly
MGKNYDVAGGGMDVLKDTVSQVVGQDIDYYIKMDFDGLVQAVDLLGGVDVDVTEDIYDYMYPDGYGGYQVFALEAGKQHLDGETALKYSRSRQTTSDFDRARRQQQVILGMKQAFLSKGVIQGATVLVQMIDVISDHLETDLKIWEWERVVKLVRDWGDEMSINSFVFDNTDEGMLMDEMVDEMYALVPRTGDFEEIHDFVEGQITTLGVKESEILSYEVMNGTNRVGLAGKVGELIEEDGNIVTNISNTEELAEETTAECNKDKVKTAKEYLLKWNIDVKASQEVMKDFDCRLILGQNFELE